MRMRTSHTYGWGAWMQAWRGGRVVSHLVGATVVEQPFLKRSHVGHHLGHRDETVIVDIGAAVIAHLQHVGCGSGK